MNKSIDTKTRSIRLNIHGTRNWLLGIWALCLGLLLQREACALTLTVVDSAGAPVTHFRWRLEEDNTATGVPRQPTYKTVSQIIRTSNAPVIASGSGSAITIPNAADKRYLLSVIADGYLVGVAKVRSTDLALLVILKKVPSPPKKINVVAIHDNNPVNYLPDSKEGDIPDCRLALKDCSEVPILKDNFGDSLAGIFSEPNLRKGGESW